MGWFLSDQDLQQVVKTVLTKVVFSKGLPLQNQFDLTEMRQYFLSQLLKSRLKDVRRRPDSGRRNLLRFSALDVRVFVDCVVDRNRDFWSKGLLCLLVDLLARRKDKMSDDPTDLLAPIAILSDAATDLSQNWGNLLLL